MIAKFISLLMVYDSPDGTLSVSWPVIIPSILFALVFIGIATRLVLQAMKDKPVTGHEGLLDEKGEAITSINSNGGSVFINGEIWKAVSEEEIARFSAIDVVKIDHLLLIVKKNENKRHL